MSSGEACNKSHIVSARTTQEYFISVATMVKRSIKFLHIKIVISIPHLKIEWTLAYARDLTVISLARLQLSEHQYNIQSYVLEKAPEPSEVCHD